MKHLPGLFLRGSSYYLKIVLPKNHPLADQYRNGRYVVSLGKCSYREAVRSGSLERAKILYSYSVAPALATLKTTRLRDVFLRWKTAQKRSNDTLAACERALIMYETFTSNMPVEQLSRETGTAFRSWLLSLSTSSKTARDRFNWIKVLLKFSAQELELITRSPWVGLEVNVTDAVRRRPWSKEQLRQLFTHEIWQLYRLPSDRKGGGDAAYWLPLLGLFTGARCSELCQLQTSNIVQVGKIDCIEITDEGDDQSVKTTASLRLIPIHSKLIDLGFMQYVAEQSAGSLWPSLPKRTGKAGGFFSQFFGELRKELNIPSTVVFHSFRHNFRTALAEANIAESIIDALLGHESGGSVGARVYTHISLQSLKSAVESLAIDIEVEISRYQSKRHQTSSFLEASRT